MTRDVEVSVAMATFNGAEFLEDQLCSIADQSRTPDELVICDDGSVDATIAIIQDFAAAVSFPVMLYQNGFRLGYAKNFMKAINACQGEIVLMCDQDDVWKHHKIDRILQEFGRNPQWDIVIHDLELIDAQGDRLNPKGFSGFVSGSSHTSFVKGCATAVRLDFVQKCMPLPDGPGGHDSWLHAIGNRMGNRHVLGEQLASYRIHGRNVSGSLPLEPPSLAVRIFRFLAYLWSLAPDLLRSYAEWHSELAVRARALSTDQSEGADRNALRDVAELDDDRAAHFFEWADRIERSRTRATLWALAHRLRPTAPPNPDFAADR